MADLSNAPQETDSNSTPTRVKKSAQNVRVACRLPAGITLQLSTGEVTLNGANSRLSSFGHGYTNLSAGQWAEAELIYGEHKFMKNGFVFAMDSKSAEAAAKERKDVNAGFNRVDPRDPSKAIPGSSVLIQKEGARDPGED